MIKKTLIFLILLVIPLSIFVTYRYWQTNIPLISPQSLLEAYISPVSTSKKEVYGFFPYWNIKYLNQLHIDQLTHLAYFAIDLDSDGSILKKVNKKELEPGWNKLNSTAIDNLLFQTRLIRRKTILTITAMDPEQIESIIDSPQNQANAIQSILEVYSKFNFDGINIDFEHIGYPEQNTRSNFTQFVTKIKNYCRLSNPNCEVDIDVFGDAGTKYRLQDLKALGSVVDRVVVMAYDYYRKTSTQSGPVAPLVGKCKDINQSNCIDQDISSNLADILKLVPAEKILLGVPFYGYQWQTATDEIFSNTYQGTGALASYQRIISLFQDNKISSLSAKWSDLTLSPYLTFVDKGKTYQIHFENPQSLDLKLKLVNNLGLGGIAIWALGYETPYLDLWQSIAVWQKSK